MCVCRRPEDSGNGAAADWRPGAAGWGHWMCWSYWTEQTPAADGELPPVTECFNIPLLHDSALLPQYLGFLIILVLGQLFVTLLLLITRDTVSVVLSDASARVRQVRERDESERDRK